MNPVRALFINELLNYFKILLFFLIQDLELSKLVIEKILSFIVQRVNILKFSKQWKLQLKNFWISLIY